MPSDVSIANQALSFLGADPIISLDDDSTEAKLIKANYANIRVALLEAVNWTFATKWADLIPLAEPPKNQYENAFPLPSTLLRVIFVGIDYNHPERKWRKEGHNIVKDGDTCTIQYIDDVPDANKFSSLFVQAFAQRLAADLSIALTNSRSLQETHFQLFESKMTEARRIDQLQGKSRRIRSRWIENGRYNYGRGGVAGPTV